MRIIGIDVGHYSIKIVESEGSFRSVHLVNYLEIPFPKSDKLPTHEEILKALGTIQGRINLSQAKIAINLPSDLATTRFITLPFTDRRKINQAIPFELEEQIPFDIDDVVIDHQIIYKEGNQSKIFACIVPQINLETILKEWKDAGINPDLVTLGSISMKNLTPVRFDDFSGIYSIINIGHSQTEVTIVREGGLLLARTIPLGGFSISKQLATTYKVDFEESERAKIEQGFVLAGTDLKVSREQEKFSESIKEGLAPIIKELQQTFLYFKTEEKHGIDQILTCGGTSLLRNINAYLQEELRTPVQHLQVLEGLSESQIPVNPRNEAILAESISLVLGGLSTKSRDQINLRKDTFAKVKREGLLEPQYAYLAKVAAIVIFLLIFNMIGKYFVYNIHYKTIEKQVSKTITQSFPNIPKVVLASPQRLKSFLEKELKSKEGKEDVIGKQVEREITPLRVVSELSMLTPDDMKIVITDLNIVNDKIKITGIVGSVEAVERLFNSYKSYPHFTKGEKKSVSPSSDGKGENFTFEFDTIL